MSAIEKSQSAPPRAFSPQQVAEQFGKHRSWVYRMIDAGKIKAITGLGEIRISEDEVRRVMAAGE